MQDLQGDLKYMFQPLINEILVNKPDNVHEFMITWLIKNRERLRNNNITQDIQSEDDLEKEFDEEAQEKIKQLQVDNE